MKKALEQLIENFEKIGAFNLVEMADKRKEAISYLQSQARTYTTHVCKIMLWGNQNPEWLKDWSDEVYNYLTNVAGVVLKNNSRLKEKFYLTEFFFKYLEKSWELETRLRTTKHNFRQKENYPEPNYLIDHSLLYKKYEKFVEIVAPMVVHNALDYKQIIKACRMLSEVV